MPWLEGAIDLSAAHVVEVGCGFGSSTAAIPSRARHVTGFDIDEGSVKAAEARCRAYGRHNVTVSAVPAAEILDAVKRAPPADVYLLYAVLEHCTYGERLEMLGTLWGLLPPGGHLAIVETPNRFAYLDKHTTETPFFHLLPDELAFRYLDRVPRVAFRDSMRAPLAQGFAEASLARIRWGLGASHHEFELALKEPIAELVVLDGYEPEMMASWGEDIDEALLVRFFLERVPDVPMAFARAVLNLVLRKPASDGDRASARDRARARREELARVRASQAPTIAPAHSQSAPPTPREALGVLRRWAMDRARALLRRH